MVASARSASTVLVILGSLLAASCAPAPERGKRGGAAAATDVVAAALEAEACGLQVGPAAPDVRAGSRIHPKEQQRWDIFNDVPSSVIAYQGTTGYVTQKMRATAAASTCRYAGAVSLKRPEPSADARFNRDCCPPGLKFAGPYSTVIEGIPTRGGSYNGTVLLCGQCRNGNPNDWHPVAARIDWNIRGQAPRRVQ